MLTSPPYGPSLHGQVKTAPGQGIAKTHDRYSTDPANLAHVGLERLLDAMRTVLVDCAQLLRPGGVVAMTVRPWWRDGELIDLPGALVRVGEDAGLVLYERNVALLAGLRDDQLVPRTSFFALEQVRKARARGAASLVDRPRGPPRLQSARRPPRAHSGTSLPRAQPDGAGADTGGRGMRPGRGPLRAPARPADWRTASGEALTSPPEVVASSSRPRPAGPGTEARAAMRAPAHDQPATRRRASLRRGRSAPPGDRAALLSQDEAARLAGCSKDTIVRARRNGRFPNARLRDRRWADPDRRPRPPPASTARRGQETDSASRVHRADQAVEPVTVSNWPAPRPASPPSRTWSPAKTTSCASCVS